MTDRPRWSSQPERAAQLERTLLAWHRTSLAALANAALLARVGVVDDQIAPIALAAVLAVAAVAARAVASRRYARSGGLGRAGLLVDGARVPLAAAVVTGAIAVTATALALGGG